MKITAIDKKLTQADQIVLHTRPPITEEVVEKLPEVWNYGDTFMMVSTNKGNFLAWTGRTSIDKNWLQEAEAHLTEAENQINAAKRREQASDQTFLEKLSNQTGLPLI